MMRGMLAYLIHLFFLVYTLLIMARIIGSWFPSFSRQPVMQLMGKVTDPYLNVFRKIIPPIGGTFDLTPILAFFVLQIAERVLMSIFY